MSVSGSVSERAFAAFTSLGSSGRSPRIGDLRLDGGQCRASRALHVHLGRSVVGLLVIVAMTGSSRRRRRRGSSSARHAQGHERKCDQHQDSQERRSHAGHIGKRASGRNRRAR